LTSFLAWSNAILFNFTAITFASYFDHHGCRNGQVEAPRLRRQERSFA